MGVYVQVSASHKIFPLFNETIWCIEESVSVRVTQISIPNLYLLLTMTADKFLNHAEPLFPYP
jgi:hypothetical protein